MLLETCSFDLFLTPYSFWLFMSFEDHTSLYLASVIEAEFLAPFRAHFAFLHHFKNKAKGIFNFFFKLFFKLNFPCRCVSRCLRQVPRSFLPGCGADGSLSMLDGVQYCRSCRQQTAKGTSPSVRLILRSRVSAVRKNMSKLQTMHEV